MKKTFIFFIVVLFSFNLFPKIPLKTAIDSAIKKNYLLSNEDLNLKIESIERAILKNEKLFRINFSGYYLYRSEQAELKMPDLNPMPGVFIPGVQMKVGTKDTFDFSFKFEQPIYTGGLLSFKTEIPELKSIQIKYKKELLKDSISYAVKFSFLNYLYLKKKKKQLELTLESLKNHLKRLKSFYNEELIKRSDIIETELKCDELKLKINDVEALISDSREEFLKLTGFTPEDIDEKYHENSLSFDESLKYLEANHPFLKTLENEKKLVLIGEKIEKASYLPQIFGFYNLHYGKPGIDFFKDEWSLYFETGISINLKIFDWGKLKRRKKVYNYSLIKIENKKDDFLRESSKTLKVLYKKKNIIEKKLKIAEKLYLNSIENLEIKKKLFEEKQVDNINYLNAIIDKEYYKTLRDMLLIELEIVKIKINRTISRR